MPFSTRQFSFNQTVRAFVADISDFGPRFAFEQLYKDSCDVGLRLCSARTGEEVAYVLDETIQNAEGEVCAWKLLPTPESAKAVPRCVGTHVLIVND